MKKFNGHRSWNAWNVSLWINNDEGLYNMAREHVRDMEGDRTRAARWFMREVGYGARTPDGAKYNHLAVYLAMEGMEE